VHRIGFVTLIVAGGLLLSSGLVPYLTPREFEDTEQAQRLLSGEVDVLLRVAAGDGPRLQRNELEAHLARLRETADAVGDPPLRSSVEALPKNVSAQTPEFLVAMSRVAKRAADVSAERIVERERLGERKTARAVALLFWPGMALLLAGFGVTYASVRRVVTEQKRLGAHLPATDESLDMRAIRLVESHTAAHERLIERSREHRDLLAEKQMLEDFKLYDPLTRLMRDDACIERAVPLVGEYLNRGASYFVVLMDLDLFKRINDTYGHDAGDEALRHFARALMAEAGEHVLVSRQHTGGDEFVAIGPGGEAEVLAFRDRLCRNLQTNVLRIPDVEESFVIGATFGYTLPTEDVLGGLRQSDTPRGRTVHLLKQLKHCDNALYMAKRSGRGSVKKYEPGLLDTVHDNPALIAFSRIDRHIRTDFPHLTPEKQSPVLEALDAAAHALDCALEGCSTQASDQAHSHISHHSGRPLPFSEG
jgi:diguanylate cyclase (GGDEF)-like protein